MKKNNDKFNFWFNAFILAGMFIAVIVTNIFKLQQPDARHFMLILASVGALMGVVNTVLSANGNIWTFLFGVIDVTIASIVALDSSIRPGGEPVWGISRCTRSISSLCSLWAGGNGAVGGLILRRRFTRAVSRHHRGLWLSLSLSSAQ